MRKCQATRPVLRRCWRSLLLGGCSGQAGRGFRRGSRRPFGCFRTGSYPGADPRSAPGRPTRSPVLADADYTGKRPVAVTLRTHGPAAQPAVGHCLRRRAGRGRDRGHHRRPDGAVRRPGPHQPRRGPVGPARDLLLQAALPLNADAGARSTRTSTPANLLNTLAYQDLDGYHVGKTAFAFDQGRQDAGYRRGKLLVHHRRAHPQRRWPATAQRWTASNTPLFQFWRRARRSPPPNRSGMSLTVTFSPDPTAIAAELRHRHRPVRAAPTPTAARCTDADNGQQAAIHQRVRALCLQRHQGRTATPASTT